MKDKKQKPKVERMEIEGLMDNDKIKWKKIPCKCAQDPNDAEHRYPIMNCIHCHCEENEKSCMDKKPFDVIENVHDKDGKPTAKTETRHINKIKIVRGKKYDEIVGWTF